LKALESQLTPLARNGTIDIWHRRKVIPGQELSREVDAHLKATHIILLLISPNYLASDGLYNEMTRAMKRYETEKVRVIPVLLRPIYWEDTPFKDLEPLPTNRKPVTRWPDKSDALDDIERGVRKAITELTTPAQTGGPSVAAAAAQSSRGEATMPNQAMPKGTTFDVFLCHNSVDKPAVREIANPLIARGLRPWLDERELRPGLPWQPELEKQIKNIQSAAVFIGKSGRGPWQSLEIQGFLREFVKRQCSIIPVILADGKDDPDVPLFLGNMTWIDFRQKDGDPMEQLVWGITGENPHYQTPGGGQQPQGQTSAPKPRGLTAGQRQRLLQERDEKQKLWNLVNEKVQLLKEELAIETDVTVKFKYKKQLAQAEAELVAPH
jgi:nucleotide-binding universal stress UspA family protein